MAEPRKTAQGTWRIQIEVRGVRDGGTFATRREAVEWRDRRTMELRAIAGGQAGTVHTLGQALRKYADEESPKRRGERWEVIRLKAFEGQDHGLPINLPLSSVTDAHIKAWRDARLKAVARGTVLRDMTLLSAVFEVARTEWKWIQTNLLHEVKKPAQPDHRERLISDAEVAAVLEALGHAPGPVRSVSQAVAWCFVAALHSGMRAGELCGLTWANVRTDYVILPMTKNGKGREVPLTTEAAAAIEAMRGFDAVLVFGLKSQTLDALFRRARDRAGLSGFTFHDARHTAATRLAPRLHVLELCRMFGWSRTDRALTYFNATASDIAGKLRR